jgi:O-antigen/teichoic acid export membrane protein
MAAASSETDTLGRKAVRGAAATGVSQLVRIALQIASVVTLARLLEPRDYGLVAMVLAVIGVADFLRDFGLGAAAVRAETLSQQERDNLFWLNTGLGLGFMTLIMLCAPLISAVYSRSELTLITIALAPSFLLSGLASQYRVDLLRRLKFGTLAWFDACSAGLALPIGIILAVAGAGYWALVAQQLTSGVITLTLLAVKCRWRPSAYDRSTPVSAFVRLGSAFVFGSLMAYVSRNADNVLIGQQFGAGTLGAYTRSVQLVRTPLTQIQSPFATVAVPVLVAAGANDRRLLEAASKGQTAMAYPIMATAAAVVAGAVPLVDLALGPQWRSVSDLIVWVAIGAAASSLATPAMWLFSVRGLGRAISGYNLTATVVTVLLLILGVQYGVEGVAAAAALAAILGWPLALVFARHYGHLPVSGLLVGGCRVVAIAVLAGVAGRQVVASFNTASSWLQLAAAAITVALVFLAALPLPGYRQDLDHMRSMGAALLPRRQR